jgi:hypothetical protein
MLTLSAHAADRTWARDDVLWLNRVTYGISSTTLDEYHRLGRGRFLVAQLSPRDNPLPAPIAHEIATLEISHEDGAQLLSDLVASVSISIR